MRFFQIDEGSILWAVVQTILLVGPFVAAVWHWARERRLRSMAFALAGSVVSSLLIGSGRPLVGDYSKPFQVTVVTILTTTLLQVLLVVYLGSEAEWSNWKVDVGLGGIAGLSLGMAQGLATRGSPWLDVMAYSAALAIPVALLLIGIRKLKTQALTSALAAALLVTVTATAVAQAVGYPPILE